MTEHTLQDNPLLDFSGLPRFDVLTPADVQPAISALLERCRALIERLTADDLAATWADFAAPLADGFEQLSRAWGMVSHVHSVNDIPAWRDAYNGMLPEVSRFYAEVGQNLKLFDKYKAIAASPNTHFCRWHSGESSTTRFAIFASAVRSCPQRTSLASRRLPRNSHSSRQSFRRIFSTPPTHLPKC
jgi:Zn-dependent oligopeptidase